MLGGDNKEESSYFPFKYIVVFLAMVLSVLLLTTQAYAFKVYEQHGSIIADDIYYDASKDYYWLEFHTDIPQSERAVEVWFRNFSDSSYSEVLTDKRVTAEQEGGSYYTGFIFNCNTFYEATYYNSSGNEIGYIKFHATDVVNTICDSGGDGSQIGGGDNDFCDCIFNSPGWEDYMGKIDDIIGAIPPPPNWQQVANTMRDTIVPRMINDLEDMLGTAPPPPAPPPNLNLNPIAPPPDEPIHDYADQLKQSEPTMNDNTELEESTYTADDIVNDAPEIEFNEDPTGGFDIMNPIETLPPTTDMPMPGEHAGEWDHQPEQQIEMDAPIPEGGGEVELGDPPIPNQPSEPAPIPDQNYMPPPTPGGEQVDMGNYKPHPDAPDGSG